MFVAGIIGHQNFDRIVTNAGELAEHCDRLQIPPVRGDEYRQNDFTVSAIFEGLGFSKNGNARIAGIGRQISDLRKLFY